MSLPRILSGIQPSGQLHIGAYLGALKNWVELQYEYDPYFCIVDLHAITVPQDPQNLHDRTLELAKLYIACGIDIKHSKIFLQSHVPQHAELAWVLNCFTYMGELEKMTQFKDKSANNQQRASSGLFNYPVLMAADILLYQANLVPVGEDQTQHLELTRDLAKRLNNKYNQELFVIPEGFTPKEGARIKGLQNPEKKMSKSSTNQNDVLYLLDDEKTITKKINKSVTDAEGIVKFDPKNKAGISNLMNILSAITGASLESIEKEFEGQQYGAFKQHVASVIYEHLQPIQEKYHELDDTKTKAILTEHAELAKKITSKTLDSVYKAIGFIR